MQYLCTICLNTVKITEKQQVTCEIIIEMNQVNPLSLISESFKYKTNIVGKTPDDNDSLAKTEVVIPLKHWSNFWRALNIRLINCEVELILTWSRNCVLADMTVDADVDPAIVVLLGTTFEIKETKLYVPVVTFSKENDIKLLEQWKTGFKRTIKWNKYRSKWLFNFKITTWII